jgi:thiol-disulfide isomerase/thioredoxin
MYSTLPKDKVAVFGVAIPRPGREEPQIVKRLAELGVKFPVLDDSNFILGQQLRVQSVPNLTIIDKSGKLQMTNGASLLQVIGYEQTVRSAVERVAKTGEVGSLGYLDHYYPVNELVGQSGPDFKAPLLSNSVEQRWTSMIKKDKVNVLIFWSVTCPHCRKELPAINAWLREHPESKLNVVSVAGIPDLATKSRTKEYCDLNKFVFPTLVDKDLSISQLYKVTSTPTIIFVGPNGVVDSVMLSASESFSERASAKVKELLGS